MVTILELKQQMQADWQNWSIYLMDFVDDFRYYKHPQAVAEGIEPGNEKIDALLAQLLWRV